MHVPWMLPVMNSWCSWSTPCRGSVSPGRWVLQERKLSFWNLASGLTAAKGSAGSAAALESLDDMAVTLGLFVLLFLSAVISTHKAVPETCFVWFSGLLQAWVLSFFLCFPHEVAFQRLALMYSMIPFLLVLMMALTCGCRNWWDLCVPSVTAHGCRDESAAPGIRWECRNPGAQGIGERTAQ